MRPGVRRAAWLALCAGGDKASSACLRVSTFMFEASCDLFFFYAKKTNTYILRKAERRLANFTAFFVKNFERVSEWKTKK